MTTLVRAELVLLHAAVVSGCAPCHEREAAFNRATIDKLTYEMAVFKRLEFAANSEAFAAEPKSLLEESIDADLEALAREIEQRAPRSIDRADKS